MALDEYRRKRDFQQTREPAPGPVKARKSNLSYLIQKHDATRLHYDFRLEWEGVLLSWAVTKGPSLDPKDKRLAVRTEDHPLSYGTFEGTIPQGQYGGGTVMLWDQGTWEPKDDPTAGLKKGHLAFSLKGERLKGNWVLVRMHGDQKKENWLLIKESDAQARLNGAGGHFLEENASSVTSGRSMEEIAGGEKARKKRKGSKASLEALMEQYPEVQLATLVDEPPEGKDWLHEIKFDGYRLLAFLVNGEVALRTRNGNDWTERFPSIVAAVKRLDADDAVLDLEAVVLDAEGKSGFQQLQAALGEGGDRSSILGFAFDLLHLNGKSLTKLPLIERKEQLAGVIGKNSSLRYSEHIAGSGHDMLANACKMDLEGVVSKEANAPYVAGRQKSWLKSKCTKRQEFIILGYSGPKSGERALGALYLGYEKDVETRYAGKVGTGFTMRSARELTEKFKELKAPLLTRKQMPDVGAGEWSSIHWVRPELLCEVAFTEWTSDGRIRHPSFQGLREDKAAEEVKKEVPMEVASVEVPSKAKTKPGALNVAGVSITHSERVISEMGHVTKGELAEYYGAAASLMLPGIGRRPVSLLRCPEGIGKECFYQRSPGRGLGKHVHPFPFQHNGKKYEYLYIEDESGLLEMIQMGAIEIHPWGAGIDSIDKPDRMIFDLDPAPDVAFDALKLAAEDIRGRLENKGLKSNLRCTGGKGLHVWVPLDESANWAEVKEFASGVAHEMVAELPNVYVATMAKVKRTGRIFVDFFRNDYTATAIADYSVRAKPGAPVAMPLAWSELANLQSPDQFTIREARDRIAALPKGVKSVPPQRLPGLKTAKASKH